MCPVTLETWQDLRMVRAVHSGTFPKSPLQTVDLEDIHAVNSVRCLKRHRAWAGVGLVVPQGQLLINVVASVQPAFQFPLAVDSGCRWVVLVVVWWVHTGFL